VASFLWASPGGAQIDNLDDDCASLSLDLETLAAGRGPAPAGAARPPVAFVKRRVILPPPFRKLPGIELAGIFSSLIDLLEKVRGRGSEEEAEQEKCERVMRVNVSVNDVPGSCQNTPFRHLGGYQLGKFR